MDGAPNITLREQQILVLERRNEYVLIFPIVICPCFGENVFEQTCYQIINTFTILKIERLWETEITDKTCQNMTLKYVSSQLECQSLCFESISCAGISYNNHGSDHCRLCKDYQLTQAPSGFGFFRRPGKYHKSLLVEMQS